VAIHMIWNNQQCNNVRAFK